MSNIPVWAMGYALRQAGVPCAEEIAMMLGKKREVIPEVPSFTDASYHIFDGTVLATPAWNSAEEPYAFVYGTSSGYTLCTSAGPFAVEKYGYILHRVRASKPYRSSVYDRTTNTWSTPVEVDADTKISASCYQIMWTSVDMQKDEGVTAEVKAPYAPEPFLFNRQNRPAAFLYTDGTMVFQNNSTPSKEYIGVFTDWDKVQYTSSTQVPWLRMDKTAITSASFKEDVVPAYSDYWFYGCENLEYGMPSGSFGEIGRYMFYGTKLKYIRVPEGITKIGDYAFRNRTTNAIGYEYVTMPASVKYIGEHAFDNISNVIEFIMTGVEEIGSTAFVNNRLLKNITIPATTKRIAPQAFKGCGLSMTGGGSTMIDIHSWITFEATDGWWVSEDADAVSGIAVDVTDTTQNALNLAGVSKWNGSYISSGHTTVNGVYENYYWNRTE